MKLTKEEKFLVENADKYHSSISKINKISITIIGILVVLLIITNIYILKQDLPSVMENPEQSRLILVISKIGVSFFFMLLFSLLIFSSALWNQKRYIYKLIGRILKELDEES